MFFFHRYLAQKRSGSFRKLCLADCFESAGDDRIEHELSRNSSLASITRKRKYTAAVSEHVLERNSRQKYHKKIDQNSVASAIGKSCCFSNCVGRMSTDDVLECRDWFHKDGDLARTELSNDHLIGEVQSSKTGASRNMRSYSRGRVDVYGLGDL